MDPRTKKVLNRFTAIVMALIMCFSVTMSAANIPVSHAAEAGQNKVTVNELNKSIESVIQSVDGLKKIMSPEEQSVIVSIFNGFVSTATTIGTVTGIINGSVAFLQLIGILSSSTGESLANIMDQLVKINEKLDEMDRKLDDISRQMSEMQAMEEFRDRGNKANQMAAAWQSFSSNYMENKMDECMRLYNNKLMDGMKAWTEYKTEDARQTDHGHLRTDMVVVTWNIKKELRPDMDLHEALEPSVNQANHVDWHHMRKDVEDPDPYTLYSGEIDTSKQQYLWLDSSFFPGPGEVSWNLDTYKEKVTDYVYQKLKEWQADYRAGKADWDRVDLKGLVLSSMPEAQLRTLASDVVDEMIYRVIAVEINKTADFSTRVVKEFGEYCDHMKTAQQGIDAMLKAIYLTNAFEYEAREDIEDFCNQMMLTTGVYGMFAMNVVGVSEYVTDTQKEKIAADMCSTVDRIQESLDGGITGEGNYCYVTNSVIDYGEITLKGHIDMKYSTRGHYESYDTYSADAIKASYKLDEDISDPNFIGDSNALVIGYFVRRAGGNFDHDYMNEHLTKTKRTKRSTTVTTLSGEQQLGFDNSVLLNVHNVVGGYFSDGSKIYLGSLPGGADNEDVVYRRQVQGTMFDGSTLGMQKNMPLIGMAAYGESHFLWEKDEGAVMAGPCNDSSFSESISDEHTGSSIILDEYYTKHYDASVTYNCLVQTPPQKMNVSANSPLLKLSEANKSMQVRTELKKLIANAEKSISAGGWTKESLAAFQKVVNRAKGYLDNDDIPAEKVEEMKTELMDAWYELESIVKEDQSLKATAKKKTLKAGALKKASKKLKAISVKGSKGKVTYSLRKVNKAKKFFKVSKTTGKITVKKGLKKGTYKLTVKVLAKGNEYYNPATKNVTVRIKVK